MEATTRNVQAWMAMGRDDEINALVAGSPFECCLSARISSRPDVSNGETTLVNIVKALGEYLTSEEDSPRTKGGSNLSLSISSSNLRPLGVELLSSVLARCPPDNMTRQSGQPSSCYLHYLSQIRIVRVLVAFYCSKLEDTETIVPALQGLLTLSRLPNCTSQDVPIIMRA